MPRYILQEKLILDPDGGLPFADISDANILDEGSLDPFFFAWPPVASAPTRRVLWSGWLGESMFELNHNTWSKDTWSRLDRWCDAALPHLHRNRATVCLRPHPRHILSDPQSCVSFLKRRGGQPFEVLLEPAGFLTPSMLPRAEDHLRRAMDALADQPGVPAVLLTNVARATVDDGLLVPMSVEGLLSPSLMQLIVSSIPPDKPHIVLSDAKLRP